MTSPLAEVRRAAAARRRAEARYHAAILTAVAELEPEGAYSRVAEAAGVSRQSVWELVRRERGI